MLFSTLHLGLRISRSQGQETLQLPKEEPPDPFLRIAAQALVAGRYQKARPYSVEATMLYAMCKFFQQHDSDSEPWLMMGVAARLALRMGYHRDPRHFPHISPFEGEMRRRSFSMIQTFELLLSYQAGLPAIIHEQVCDTDQPSNLFDEDFDEDSVSIPPSRPFSVPTPMLYYRYKGLMAKTFRKIARQALSPTLPSYEDVMQLEEDLLKVRADIPPSLVWRPFGFSILDESQAKMHRLNLELLHQKSLMTLHRRYLSHERANPAFEHSRTTCINASMQVLQYQVELYQATQPGGSMYTDQWTASSLALHDFLMAGMTICLDLYESHLRDGDKTLSAAESEVRRKKYEALKISQHICQKRKTISSDARKAANVLEVMLSKIPCPNAQPEKTMNGIFSADTDVSESFSQMDVNGSTVNDSLGNWGLPGLLDLAHAPYPYAKDDDPALQDSSAQPILDDTFAESDIIDWVGLTSAIPLTSTG